jgi:ribose transport system substrate-binding protein
MTHITQLFRSATIAGVMTLSGVVGGVLPAWSQEATEDSLRVPYIDALKGKKIVFVATTLSVDLVHAWDYWMNAYAKQFGMDYSSRDANWSTQAQVQAMDALIEEKPDVIVVQNFNVSLLARQIKRAEQAGIPVIQLNMKSLQDSTAFVGVDLTNIGRVAGDEIVKQCGSGTNASGEVVVLVGDITAADGVYMTEGLREAFAKDSKIKIVATQSTAWDPNKAHDVTATLLQQHPNVCAIFGVFGVMTMGAAQAVKEAGLQGKVRLYSSDGGSRYGCEAVKNGDLTKFWSYNSPGQARDVIQLATYLIQNKVRPGTLRGAVYSPLVEINKDNVRDDMCWDPQW